MKNNHIRMLWVCAVVLWLAGCASPATRQALIVDDTSFNVKNPYSVNVSTSGGGETGAMDYVNISNENLASAIEESIAKSGLFSSVVKGNDADYKLNVSLVSMSKPMFGLDFKIDMEMAWSLVNAKTGKAIMRESIKSSYTATPSDAFIAAKRVRLAVEGAAQNNIRQGLQKIAGLSLN
ncbi:hypothetical protein MNBD_GAMMA14-1779 [hydrothermal vent metagenome]|uniref:Lipoprotein n=1 Tax=hydrothermal vent metagenome TaxID=652676 RepID=A0A3B0YBV1_9ZZZZ